MAPVALEDDHGRRLHRWCPLRASRSAKSRAVEPGHARLTSGGGGGRASSLGLRAIDLLPTFSRRLRRQTATRAVFLWNHAEWTRVIASYARAQEWAGITA